jgi:Cu2+-exporting ATPase
VTWCATVFYRGAWGALKTRALHMDLPIAIGIFAGFIQGAINTVRDAGEIYFDSVTALIFFLLVGRFLQRRQQLRAASSTELLFSLAPTTARLVGTEGVREVPLEALTAGAVVEVRAGDSVPADGTVREGASTLDRSLLTGESLPEPVAVGDPVHAGTVNLGSRLLVEVRATGEDTRVGRLMRLVEEGAMRRAPVVLLADRISGWFVAIVLALAAITVGVWLKLDPEHAVEHAVALLIVSCPCALGLATPLAVSSAIGRAARRKILVKGGDALENLARPGRMILDKTGTLTEGRLAVISWWGDESIKPIVAAIERHSAHPVAQALSAISPEDEFPEVCEVEEITGAGMSGVCDGRAITIASTTYFDRELGGLAAEAASTAADFATEGLSPVAVAVDGEVVAVVGIGDPLRPDSAASVASIRDRGWQVAILSGDHPAVVQSVADQIGIEPEAARGAASPEEKLQAVRDAAAGTTAAMVGDGVNDAAALATATVGIGVHGGAEAALAAADVYLARPGLEPVVELLNGARRTLGVIRRNLVFSLAYNVVAVSFAISGHMSPLLAAILMPLSSMTVVLSSYRARTF